MKIEVTYNKETSLYCTKYWIEDQLVEELNYMTPEDTIDIVTELLDANEMAEIEGKNLTTEKIIDANRK